MGTGLAEASNTTEITFAVSVFVEVLDGRNSDQTVLDIVKQTDVFASYRVHVPKTSSTDVLLAPLARTNNFVC